MVAGSCLDSMDQDAALSFLQLSKAATTDSHTLNSKYVALDYNSKIHNKTEPSQGSNASIDDDDWWAHRECAVQDPLPKSNRTNRKPVMWVHVHKAAGTHMCCEARRRENVVKPAGNCNLAIDGWLNWENQSVGPFTTCEKRTAYMQENGFTWGAIERWLDHGDLCPGSFVYATVLKDPIKTMQSEADYVNKSMPWVSNITQCIEDRMFCKDRNRTKCQDDGMPCREFKDWYIFDNFMVRTFSGIGLTVPPGKVNESHLNAAVQVLRGFDLVLLLDRLDDPRTARAYENTIGWPLTLSSNRSARTNNKDERKVDFKKRTFLKRRLMRINSFDLDLIKFFKLLNYP